MAHENPRYTGYLIKESGISLSSLQIPLSCEKPCDQRLQRVCIKTNERNPSHLIENRIGLFSTSKRALNESEYQLNCRYQYAIRTCGGTENAEKLWKLVAHAIEQRRYSHTEMIRLLLQSFAYDTPICMLPTLRFCALRDVLNVGSRSRQSGNDIEGAQRYAPFVGMCAYSRSGLHAVPFFMRRY